MGSWQTQVYEQLRDREWHHLGELFDEIEKQIPLHYAMRFAMQPRRGLTELPTIPQARWYKFLNDISTIGIETSGDPLRRKWTDQVRLRYVSDRSCADCGGPVIKASWTAKAKVACLSCESKAAPQQGGIDHPVLPAPPLPAPTSPQPVVVTHAGMRPLEKTSPRRRQSDRHRAKMALKGRARALKPDRVTVMLQTLRWIQDFWLRARGGRRARGPPAHPAILRS